MKDVRQELRGLINEMGHNHPHTKARALELIDLLVPVTDRGAGSGRGEAEVVYSVESSINGLVLNERRNGRKSHPLRCPAAVYDGVVKVLAAAERPLPLDEIVAAVAEQLGDQPPDYQVRVPLRLWMHAEPPLLVRNRARYRPIDTASFALTAVRLWDDLRTP